MSDQRTRELDLMTAAAMNAHADYENSNYGCPVNRAVLLYYLQVLIDALPEGYEHTKRWMAEYIACDPAEHWHLSDPLESLNMDFCQDLIDILANVKPRED